MPTTSSHRTSSIPLVPSRLATPPPSVSVDLLDGETVVGWIDGTAIGFGGFGDETEAVHAAWVAYRTMSRRFARGSGRRPLPIDTAPLALGRSGDVELILANGQPIATLVRPGSDGRSGAEFHGFELQVPTPADELTMRSISHLVYRTLRRSGIRWAMRAPAPRPPSARPAADAAESAARATDRERSPGSVAGMLSRRGIALVEARRQRDGAARILGSALIVVAMLTVVILPAITTSTVVLLLGGAAGMLAIVAVASLVRVVVTDVRDSFRERLRTSPGAGDPVGSTS